MKIMGHRGARDVAPENSLRSFEAAINCGLTCIEFDIHQIKDGEFIVHHDDTLERTTTGVGKISDYSLSELQNYTLKDGDKIPTLNDVLELTKNKNIELQIELKNPGDWNQLKKILINTKMVHLFTVISFNHRWLFELKEIFPEIKTACLMYALPVQPELIIQATKCNGISLNVQFVDLALVERCHQFGHTVTAWNANDIETFTRLNSYGVDYLGTDIPHTAKAWI
jgi:glycerophosphoryl diester phosphodiesterase